jgi:hypothetical protein
LIRGEGADESVLNDMGTIVGVCGDHWTSCLRSKEVEHLSVL